MTAVHFYVQYITTIRRKFVAGFGWWIEIPRGIQSLCDIRIYLRGNLPQEGILVDITLA